MITKNKEAIETKRCAEDELFRTGLVDELDLRMKQEYFISGLNEVMY